VGSTIVWGREPEEGRREGRLRGREGSKKYEKWGMGSARVGGWGGDRGGKELGEGGKGRKMGRGGGNGRRGRRGDR